MMFYYGTKILGILSFASNITFAIGLLGLLIWVLTRFKGFGRFLMVLSFLTFGVLGFTPVGNLLVASLENRFPPTNLNAGPELKGIIVLGGSIETHVSTGRGQPALNDAAERLTVIPDLARRFPHAKIIFTGGVGLLQDQFFNDQPEATAAKQLLLSVGMDPERMIFEDKARNTVENAQFTYEMLKPAPGDHYLLVTSAYHMPRSMALFRKAGFTVEPYPVDYRTGGPEDAARFFYSMSEGLRQADLGTREWIGLLGYYWTGRTTEVFPKP